VLEFYLDGRRRGTIFRKIELEVYFCKPLSANAQSKDYPTLDAMKASLEGKDEEQPK
jgi:hypothetical protein